MKNSRFKRLLTLSLLATSLLSTSYAASRSMAEVKQEKAAQVPGATPFHIAIMRGDYRFFDVINDASCINTQDFIDRTPLAMLSMKGGIDGHRAMANALKAGANANIGDEEDRTPLMHAAFRGDFIGCAILIAGGADVNHADKKGRTALDLVFLKGRKDAAKDSKVSKEADRERELVADLIRLEGGRNGVVDFAKKRENIEKLHAIVRDARDGKDGAEAVKQYIAAQGDVDDKDLDGRTALHIAAIAGKVFIAEQLIDLKASVDQQCTLRGRTPLHFASKGGYPEMVQLLLKKEANPLIRDHNGHLPSECAVFWMFETLATPKDQRKGSFSINNSNDDVITAFSSVAALLKAEELRRSNVNLSVDQVAAQTEQFKCDIVAQAQLFIA